MEATSNFPKCGHKMGAFPIELAALVIPMSCAVGVYFEQMLAR